MHTVETEVSSYSFEGIEKDRINTLRNREKLFKNKNLLYWYKSLYDQVFIGAIKVDSSLKILEVGSGVSPLKHFMKSVITSDILPMDHIDINFDALKISEVDQIKNESLDIITVTNVLHHLERPLDFIQQASKKLRSNGKIIFIEPYFSKLSSLIYIYLHHENTDFNVIDPVIEMKNNPLETSNICLPYLIFIKKKEGWLNGLETSYNVDKLQVTHFSSLSYVLTGGISRRIPLPHWLFRLILPIDRFLARSFPRLFAFEFIGIMSKKSQ